MPPLTMACKYTATAKALSTRLALGWLRMLKKVAVSVTPPNCEEKLAVLATPVPTYFPSEPMELHHWEGAFPGAAQLLLPVWLKLPEAEKPDGSLQLQASTGVEVSANKVGAATRPPRRSRRRLPEDSAPEAGLTSWEAVLDGWLSSMLFTFLPLFQCGACDMLANRQPGGSPCPSCEDQSVADGTNNGSSADQSFSWRIVEEGACVIDGWRALNSGGQRGFYSQNRLSTCFMTSVR